MDKQLAPQNDTGMDTVQGPNWIFNISFKPTCTITLVLLKYCKLIFLRFMKYSNGHSDCMSTRFLGIPECLLHLHWLNLLSYWYMHIQVYYKHLVFDTELFKTINIWDLLKMEVISIDKTFFQVFFLKGVYL